MNNLNTSLEDVSLIIATYNEEESLPFVLNEIKDYAWHAFSSLGCSKWGRVDFIEDKEGNFQIIEVNTVPGLTETSLFPKAASYEGIDFDELIIKVLHLSCK